MGWFVWVGLINNKSCTFLPIIGVSWRCELATENCGKNGLVYFAFAEVFFPFPHPCSRMSCGFYVIESSANVALEFDMLGG